MPRNPIFMNNNLSSEEAIRLKKEQALLKTSIMDSFIFSINSGDTYKVELLCEQESWVINELTNGIKPINIAINSSFAAQMVPILQKMVLK